MDASTVFTWEIKTTDGGSAFYRPNFHHPSECCDKSTLEGTLSSCLAVCVPYDLIRVVAPQCSQLLEPDALADLPKSSLEPVSYEKPGARWESVMKSAWCPRCPIPAFVFLHQISSHRKQISINFHGFPAAYWVKKSCRVDPSDRDQFESIVMISIWRDVLTGGSATLCSSLKKSLQDALI